MKKNKHKEDFLNNLKKIPIVQVACEKSSLSRNTVYRWRKENSEFATEMDNAIKEGEDFINDMGEVQVIQLIKEKDFQAIKFWLTKRSPRFRDKVEITTKRYEESLSPEEEDYVKNALRLSNINYENNSNDQE